jgi:hypothetical protein
MFCFCLLAKNILLIKKCAFRDMYFQYNEYQQLLLVNIHDLMHERKKKVFLNKIPHLKKTKKTNTMS